MSYHDVWDYTKDQKIQYIKRCLEEAKDKGRADINLYPAVEEFNKLTSIFEINRERYILYDGSLYRKEYYGDMTEYLLYHGEVKKEQVEGACK